MPGGVPAHGFGAAALGHEFRGDCHRHDDHSGVCSEREQTGELCGQCMRHRVHVAGAIVTRRSWLEQIAHGGREVSTFSTNTGSTCRGAYGGQMARPSAPCDRRPSPAAYTSVTTSASAPESARPKCNQSRVARIAMRAGMRAPRGAADRLCRKRSSVAMISVGDGRSHRPA